MMPACSPGSNHVGAIEMCTAHVRVPSGAALVEAGASAAARSAATTTRTLRLRKDGGADGMQEPPRREVPDYLRMVRAVNMRKAISQPGKSLSLLSAPAAAKRSKNPAVRRRYAFCSGRGARRRKAREPAPTDAGPGAAQP